jgi:hypothetical protein
MYNTPNNVELIEALLNSLEFKRYVIGIIAIFIIPPVLNFLTTLYKNRSSNKLIRTIELSIDSTNDAIKEMKGSIDILYRSKFMEGTVEQLNFTFKTRTHYDISTIVKNVKRLIIINHILTDIPTTKLKIRRIVTNVHNRSKQEFNCFLRNNKPVGTYFLESWIDLNVSAVEDFVLNNRITDNNNNYTYNYDLLRSKLITNYESIIYEFDENINK